MLTLIEITCCNT